MAEGQSSRGAVSAHDGSDHEYRMLVEDRYKRMANARKTIKMTSRLQLVYIVARSLWKFLPTLRNWEQYAYTDQLILVAGVGLYLFYRYAFGYGRAQHEKQWAVFGYALGSMVLLAECFLTFWIYHVMLGPHSPHKSAVDTYPPIPRGTVAALERTFGLSPTISAGALTALNVFEKAFEVLGMGAWFIGVLTVREYAVDARDTAREKAGQRKSDRKAE